MLDKIPPQIRIAVYVIGFVAVVFLAYNFVVAPTLEAREDAVLKIQQIDAQEAQKARLSQQKEEHASAIRNLEAEIGELEAQRIGETVSRESLQNFLETASEEKDVSVEHVEYIHFWNESEIWRVALQIEIAGVYRDVLELVSMIEEVGGSYYTQDTFIMQQGPREVYDDPDLDWANSARYLSYTIQEEERPAGDYYVDGQIMVPVFIRDRDGKASPYLRLKDIRYSDDTILRYNWRAEKATVVIGEKEYEIGYPEVDFNEQELRLNVDFPLEPPMIGKEIKAIKMYWRSENRAHEVTLGIDWPPVVVTEEMFLDEGAWEGEINRELASYSYHMFNSIISTRFNIIFAMKEEPAAYFNHVAAEISRLRELAQDAGNIEVGDDGQRLVIEGDEGVFEYLIDDQKLFVNGSYLFALEPDKENKFFLQNDSLDIQLSVFSMSNELNYNLSLSV
ncbi:MAG: hypothetical protein AVO34_14520 [Firmicutes bacterium ML8_F2]|nr:MAG: hypothetical protein AVO34_14520 [Firmicutes bacterium ML8_F2]